MGDTALGERGAAARVDERAHVARAHDLLVVDGDILEEGEEVDFLLVMRADQIVVGLAGDRDDRRAVHLGVVKTVEQVDRAGTRRREADAEPARVLRVAARHERRGLFVAHLHERDALLPFPQRLHDAVDAVARQTEHDAHIPVDEAIGQHIRSRLCHMSLRRN